YDNLLLPVEYDVRTAYPGCADYVLDQGSCGSCWAFATAESLSDRYCVMTGDNTVLSPQELVDCDRLMLPGGCSGGEPYLANDWLEWNGLVPNECYPYVSGHTHERGTCHSDVCTDGSEPSLKVYVEAMSAEFYDNPTQIQKAIMDKGTVAGTMIVYEDFYNYKGGVYEHAYGAMEGGHAIAIVGWGVDSVSNLPYWTVRNSWGYDFGEDGYFRILRGMNMCEIELGGSAATPFVDTE
ncbi:peptidase C1A, partial [Kipferlia bialata]